MSWNEPGGGKKDPWSGRGGDDKGPPDLDEAIRALQEKIGGKWLTTDFKAGDFLCFGMFLLHCSTDNQSPDGKLRISTDTRYQLASEPADERWVGDDPLMHKD